MREIIDEMQELSVEHAGFGGNDNNNNDPWSLENSLSIAKRLCFLQQTLFRKERRRRRRRL